MDKKRKSRLIVPLIFWAVLTAISLSCNEPAAWRYMVIESIQPVSTGIGEWITVTVSITGKETPATGSVVITGDSQCSFQLTNGRGSCRVFFRTAGAHTISVDYAGDGYYYGEYAQRPYTVVAALTPTPITPTNLSISHSPDPSSPGEAVEFRVRVSPSQGPPPTGVVTISSSGEPGCTASLFNGEGMCTIAFTTPGARTLTATYPITGAWVGSTATTTVTVSYPTQITLTISPASPTVGQTVTATVTVSVIDGGSTPTGDVSITYDPGSLCDDFTLVNGSGSCTFKYTSIGEKQVEALYMPTDSQGESTTDFLFSTTIASLTVRAAVVQPPPEPRVGCMVYGASDTGSCEVPCPDPSMYLEVCTVP
jgi:hypothetical protein